MSKLTKVLAGAIMLHDVALCNTVNKAVKKHNEGYLGNLFSSLAMATISVPHVLVAQHLWNKKEVSHSQKYHEHINRYMKRYKSGEYSIHEFSDRMVELMYRHPGNAFTRSYVYKKLLEEAPEVLEDFKRNTMAFQMLIQGPDCFDDPNNEGRDVEEDAKILMQFNEDVTSAAAVLANTMYEEEFMKSLVALGLAFDHTVDSDALEKFNGDVRRLSDRLDAANSLVMERDKNNLWLNVLIPFIDEIRDGKYRTRELALDDYTMLIANHPEIDRYGQIEEFERKVSEQLDITFPEDRQPTQEEVRAEEDDEAYFQQFAEDLFTLRFSSAADAWGHYESMADSLFNCSKDSRESFDKRATDLIDQIYKTEDGVHTINHSPLLAHFTAKVNGEAFPSYSAAVRKAGKLIDASKQFKLDISNGEFEEAVRKVVADKNWDKLGEDTTSGTGN